MRINRRLDTDIVYITGGSSGLGLACAELLYPHARVIVLLARNAKRLADAAGAIRSANSARRRMDASNEGAQVETIAVDISNETALRSRLSEAVARYGAPTLLLNNAGFAHPGYFIDFPQSKYQEMRRTNIDGAWNVLQILMPTMQAGSAIINVASFAALLGIIGYSAYSLTKYALFGLTEALRNEYAPKGITINILCPSDIETPQLEYERAHKPPETAALAGSVRPLSPSFVARYALRHAGGRRFLLIPGLYPRIIWLLKRLWPRLVYAIIDHDLRKAIRSDTSARP